MDSTTNTAPSASEDAASRTLSGRGFIARRWKVLAPVAVALGALGIWLFFGYFGFHTLFFDEKVDEAVPVFASGDSTGDSTSDGTGDGTADEPAPPDPASDAGDDGPPATAVPVVETTLQGTFVDRSHPGRGTALVLSDGAQRFLRFEDFATDNGPDLNVYLSSAPPDADASAFDDDFVDLGDLKGNEGNQNYELPPDLDLDRYSTVVVWCVRFSVAFTVAPLA